jgi:hypothetical protein
MKLKYIYFTELCQIDSVYKSVAKSLKLYEYDHGKNVQLSLCLSNSALRHEDVWWSGCVDHVFLTSAIFGGKWSASRPWRFTPIERAADTRWIGG